LALLSTQVLKLFSEQKPKPSRSAVPHSEAVPARVPLVMPQHSESVHGANLAEKNLACPTPHKTYFFGQISAISWLTTQSQEH